MKNTCKLLRTLSVLLVFTLLFSVSGMAVSESQGELIPQDKIFKLKNAESGKYINVAYGYDTENLNVYQLDSEDKYVAQDFRIHFDEEAKSYTVRPICSAGGRNRALTAKKIGASPAEGSNIQLNEPEYINQQLFDFTKLANGSYKITLAENPALAITAQGSENGEPGGKTPESEGNIYLSQYTESDSQHWILEESPLDAEYSHYSAMGLKYPFVGSSAPTRISSSYGFRKHPISLLDHVAHAGLDIPASGGTKLYGAFKGVVKKIGYNAVSGNYIVVEATEDDKTVFGTDTKLRYCYMHLRESATLSNEAIVPGAVVDTETVVGKVGTTGGSTGNHLHLAFFANGSSGASFDETVNPMFFYPNVEFRYKR